MRVLLSVTFWTGLLTLFRMAIGFAITKVVAVYGGPSGVALLGQLQSIVTTLNGIMNAPIGNGVVRYTAENYENGIEYCVPWWRAGVQFAIGLYIIALILLAFFSKELAGVFLSGVGNSWLVMVAGLLLPFTAIGTFINSVINGTKDYKKYVLVGGISTLFSFFVMVVLIYWGGLQGALLAVCIQYALVGLFSVIFVFRQKWFRVSNFLGRVSRVEISGISSYITMAVVSAIALPTSLLLIRNEMTAELGWVITGHWQAVWRISEVYLSVLTLTLSIYYLPRLSSLKDKSDFLKEVHFTSRVMFFLSAFLAFSVYLLRDYIILFLYSPEFLSARGLFFLQLIGDCLKLNNWVYSYPMLARGLTKWYIFLEIFFSMVFFLFAYGLLKFTAIGVESVLYSYIFVQAVCFIFLRFSLKSIISESSKC